MSSTMHTIREMAADSATPLSDVLEKALFQATVLRHKPIQTWLRQERDGYATDEPVPEYRRADDATLLAWRPGAGWIQAPVDSNQTASLAPPELRIDVLELVRNRSRINKDGGMQQEPEEAVQAELRASTRLDTRLAFAIPAHCYERVLDTVRLGIKVWSDRLLEAGIEGHGSAFTREEKELARPIGDQLDEILAEATAQQAALPSPAQPGFMARILGRAGR